MSASTPADSIPVWPDQIPDAALWRDVGPELERPRSPNSNSRLIRNISQPTLTAYVPDPANATGAGVIVCPGGAFHFLSIDKEGTEVARWLTARGVAALVLKYQSSPRQTTTTRSCRSPRTQRHTVLRWMPCDQW